jgi:hypothetical protein
MKRSLLISILVIIPTLLVSVFSACETLLNQPVLPTNSGYSADIIGNVIITEKVIWDGSEMTLPERLGKISWIVEIQVRNVAYDKPISESGWKISVGDELIGGGGGLGDFSGAVPMNVLKGQTGETIIRFIIPSTWNIDNAKLCYAGQEPTSYGKLTGGKKVAYYDWESKTPVVQEKQPSGVYNATILGIEQTATFKGDTLTLYNDYDGKRVFEYSFPRGLLIENSVIQLKNVVTEQTTTKSFKYTVQYDSFLFENIEYHKK